MRRHAWQRRAAGIYLELRVIPVLLWSFSAIALGSALAVREGELAAGWLVAALVVGLLLQGLVAHTVNEVTDWRSGTDRDPAPRLLSGGSKVIRAGLLTEVELRRLGAAAAVVATALGIIAAAGRGWWLLALGGAGLAGAVAYTLPPIAAAYVPFAGEGVAFLCVWACALGGFGIQRGDLSGSVFLVGAAHAAYCVSMLMLHHHLDRGPDSRANPPKVTSVVRLGSAAKAYGIAWSAAATALSAAAAAAVDVRLTPLLVSSVIGLAAHATVDAADAASVTRGEAVVIAAGIAGALTASVLLAPILAWLVAVPAVLVPIELAVAGRWLTPPGDHPSDPHGGPPSAAPQSPRPA